MNEIIEIATKVGIIKRIRRIIYESIQIYPLPLFARIPLADYRKVYSPGAIEKIALTDPAV